MSKTKKIWLGVLSFTPLLMSIIFGIFTISIYSKLLIGIVNPSLNYANGGELLYSMMWLIIIGILLSVVSYVVLVVFTICIVKNKKIDETAKILYLLGIYFIYIVIPIVYFFIEVAGKNNDEEIEELY